MLSLLRPSDQEVNRRLAGQQDAAYTYDEVGCTKSLLEATPNAKRRGPFNLDRTRALLGCGQECYTRSCDAIRRWEPCNVGWASLHRADTPFEAGQTIAIVACTYGLWSVNVSRLIYTIDEVGEIRRFGFAYGTLPHHVERGEERFCVEWDQQTDQVWYRISAVSEPHHWLVKAGYRLARRTQWRFARDSVCRMRSVVKSG